MNTQQFVNTKEACEFLKVSRSTLSRLIKNGKVRIYATAKKENFFNRDELLNLWRLKDE